MPRMGRRKHPRSTLATVECVSWAFAYTLSFCPLRSSKGWVLAIFGGWVGCFRGDRMGVGAQYYVFGQPPNPSIPYLGSVVGYVNRWLLPIITHLTHPSACLQFAAIGSGSGCPASKFSVPSASSDSRYLDQYCSLPPCCPFGRLRQTS